MANKFEILEKSLVITDVSQGKVLLDTPKNDLYYLNKFLDDGIIVLYDISSSNKYGSEVHRSNLSDAVDKNSTAYTKATFINFCRKNLGVLDIEISKTDIEKIKQASDYSKALTYLDAGTDDERVSTIVHSSTSLSLSKTETFTWTESNGIYRLTNVALS